MHMQRCRVRFSPLTIEHYSMVEVTAQLSESPQEWNSLSLIETTKVREINTSWLRQRGGGMCATMKLICFTPSVFQL